MTVMAVNPQAMAGTGTAPAKAAGARGARSAPPAAGPSRPRRVPLTPMRQQAAKSMRRLAQHIQQDHPELTVHQHLHDAARTLEGGSEEAAQRHLRAAVFALTPQSLHRNGVHDDDGHISARQAVHGVHRHLLLVKDIQDVAAKNQERLSRFATEDGATSPPPAYGGDPGALAQKPAARQPGGDRAMNAPDRTNSGGSDPAAADPVGPQPRGSKQFASCDEVCRVVALAADGPAVRTWDELASVVELSARTAMLEVTPAPRGKPGGPGLYDVKGMGHTNYEQQIVKALIEKRGMPPGKAYAIARGAIRKWSRGGGKVHPEVRAAAGAAEAGELAKQARAKAVHGHASTWDDVAGAVELSAAPRGWDGVALELALVTALVGQPQQQPSAARSANASAQPRVGAGSPAGGQFAVSGSGGQQQAKGKQAKGQKKQARKAKKAAKKTRPPSAAQQKAARKKALLAAAKGYRTRAVGLLKQIQALQKIVSNAQKSTGKTVKASSNVTGTSAPAKTSAAATTAGTPAASAATAAKTATPAATAKPPTASQAKAQLAPLRQQYAALMKQAASATAQAAKL